MTTTTTSTFSLGGLVLNTLGYNLDVLPLPQHSRAAPYQSVARRPGSVRRQPRELPLEFDLSMWVADRDADGVPGGETQLWANLQAILAKLGPARDQLTMTRIRAGTTLTLAADFVGPTTWDHVAPNVVRLQADFIAAYPYWLGASTNDLLSGGSGTVTNAGQADAHQVTVTLEPGGSGWTDPVVNNAATGVELSYTGTIASDDTVTINLWAGTAVDGNGASVSGAVSCNTPYFLLAPGDNSISTSDSSGSGDVRVVALPPYLA